MTNADAHRFGRILGQLTADDAAWLRSLVEPKSIRRLRRMEARDNLVRTTIAGIVGPNLTDRCCTLERRLNAAARGATADKAAAAILAMCDRGKPIGWKTLYDLCTRRNDLSVRNFSAGVANEPGGMPST